jgi:hypothetical protein
VVVIFVEALLKKGGPKVVEGKAKFGSAKVKIWMAIDFNAPIPGFDAFTNTNNLKQYERSKLYIFKTISI